MSTYIIRYNNKEISIINSTLSLSSNIQSYKDLSYLSTIHNIILNIPINGQTYNEFDIVTEINMMFDFFKTTHSHFNSLEILSNKTIIYCLEACIEELSFNSNNFLTLNIISNSVSILDSPIIYQRKRKLDKILNKINGK